MQRGWRALIVAILVANLVAPFSLCSAQCGKQKHDCCTSSAALTADCCTSHLQPSATTTPQARSVVSSIGGLTLAQSPHVEIPTAINGVAAASRLSAPHSPPLILRI